MKFSIRDLFLVTVIVAILVAWWVDRSRASQRLGESQDEVKELESDNLRWKTCAFRLRDILRADGWSVDIMWSTAIEAKKKLPNSQAPAPNPPKKWALSP
jgi:hypothetical protein